jgi:hypothetical protein
MSTTVLKVSCHFTARRPKLFNWREANASEIYRWLSAIYIGVARTGMPSVLELAFQRR